HVDVVAIRHRHFPNRTVIPVGFGRLLIPHVIEGEEVSAREPHFIAGLQGQWFTRCITKNQLLSEVMVKVIVELISSSLLLRTENIHIIARRLACTDNTE